MARRRCDWDALLRRSGSRARVDDQVWHAPESFVAFDFLALHGHDTRLLSRTDRHTLLEQTAAGWRTPLQLAPHTRDHAEALT